MLVLTLKDVAELAGGRLEGDPETSVAAVTTDTRRPVPGALFVPLVGDAADGHDFLDEARAFAAAALVRDGAVVPAGLAAVRVPDTLLALQRLAAGVRSRLAASVVAITGSSGKTCTKDFTAAVLAGSRRVTASEASYNNEIGVPLTVLAADALTDVIVAEVGSRGIGHIAALMPVLQPDVAVVTNVGVAHHEMFGSVKAIARSKGELVEALPPDGVAVLNADDPDVSAMAARAAGAVITFGMAPKADVRATDVGLDEHVRARFTLVTPGGSAHAGLQVAGEHMIANALAAAAVAHLFGMTPEQTATRLATAGAPAARMEIREARGGWLVIDDTYNANPASVAAALRALVALGRGRRTWAVLGVMAELGDISAREHEGIGRLVTGLGVDRLVTVGGEARPLHDTARREGMTAGHATFAPDAAAAAAAVLGEVRAGDVVLVKASRAARLERVVEEIVA